MLEIGHSVGLLEHTLSADADAHGASRSRRRPPAEYRIDLGGIDGGLGGLRSCQGHGTEQDDRDREYSFRHARILGHLCPVPCALCPLPCLFRCNIPRSPEATMSRRFTLGAVFLLRSRGRLFRPRRPLSQPSTSLSRAVSTAAATQAGPIKLARYPDYHAGRIAFSYMGDIWVAGEDGSNPVRLTVNTARETYPRFSPDGRWIAFSSNRFGNNDVFVVSASGGMPRQLTFFSGADDVVGWSRDGQQVLFRSAHGDGAFPNVATLYQVALAGGPEKPLPVDWGYYGDFSPDGKSLVFNRHPATWTRKHYRGSYAADIWIADLAQKTYRQLLPDDQFNRYWPMWGSDNNIYFVADPLPNEKNVKPGALEVYKSANNIYRVPAGGGQAMQLTKHTSGSLFWPSMSADGKTIVYEESFGVWKLDVASGRTTEIKIDVTTDDKENEFEVATVQNEVDSFDLSPSGQRAVISARGQIMTIATNRGDITRIAPGHDGHAKPVAQVVAGWQVRRVHLGQVRTR
jgi:hypothetical protein